MTKRQTRPPPKPQRGKRPHVRHTDGTRQPFLRGMVTHDLVQRGVPFDDAYAVARALTDRLSGRDDVTTVELREMIEVELGRALSPAQVAALELEVPAAPRLLVTFGGDAQPFSRGALAQSLFAAGIDLDRAYALVLDLQSELVRDGVARIEARDLGLRVADLLERLEGKEAAGRYRLMRAIQRLPRPLVIYLGGAVGTGKSTLALQLAPLLRIYRINATDTIRQVMRMVFSPAMLPSLHRSSFELQDERELLIEGAGLEDDPSEALVRAFEAQAARVCVGVRGVVERSVAENTNVLVEGVHLLPSIVPFGDLGGAAYQQMVMLSTMDEETHRSFLLSRRDLLRRQPERYLENFAAIRVQQQHLLHLAEDFDVPLLDSTERDSLVPRALRLLTGRLQNQLPWLARSGSSESGPPALLLFVDGMADHPLRALGGRTPLQAADTPTFDRLAREGRSGLADPIGPGVVPDTASGSLALFGQSPMAMRRGPIEALGAGLQLAPTDVALRANFATIDERGIIVDRRAGRIRERAAELAKALDRLQLAGESDVTVRVMAGTEHRLAVVLHGPGLSASIAGSDPGEAAPPGPPLVPRPLDPSDEAAARTARILAIFEQEAQRVLREHPVNAERALRGLPPANAVLTRGAGHVARLRPIEPGGMPISAACVSGDRTVLGIARLVGASTHTTPAMTANLDTDLAAKFAAAARLLRRNQLVVVHVKGADIASHDGQAEAKVEFLERIDRELGRLLERVKAPLRVAVAADHGTHADTGQHSADAVPVLFWGTAITADAVQSFDEHAAAAGALQRFPLQLLVDRLLGPG